LKSTIKAIIVVLILVISYVTIISFTNSSFKVVLIPNKLIVLDKSKLDRDSKGRLIFEGEMLSGYLIKKNSNNDIIEKKGYLNGYLEGKSVGYFDNGKLKFKRYYHSGKKVGNKTASSPVASATVKPLFDGWIEDFTSNVAPAVSAGTTASSGIAGSYTDTRDDGTTGRTVKVNAKGFELNQIFSKGLIGAFQVDQIINNYLSFSKLDGAREDNDNGVYGYKNDQAENYITKMEHYWDEGFGYLYGLDSQFKAGLGDAATGKDTANLNYYLNKVNSKEEPGISQKIYDAFIAGRAAIVAKDYDERDKQAGIVSAEISKVIGYKAESYLRDGAEDITNGMWADAHHALSEGYGFILGLQFTKNTEGNPYMNNEQVNSLLSRLSAGDGGFWERTPEELKTMADEIAQATGL